jgi:hypothetical protein
VEQHDPSARLTQRRHIDRQMPRANREFARRLAGNQGIAINRHPACAQLGIAQELASAAGLIWTTLPASSSTTTPAGKRIQQRAQALG